MKTINKTTLTERELECWQAGAQYQREKDAELAQSEAVKNARNGSFSPPDSIVRLRQLTRSREDARIGKMIMDRTS